jgi:hypothetical protein
MELIVHKNAHAKMEQHAIKRLVTVIVLRVGRDLSARNGTVLKINMESVARINANASMKIQSSATLTTEVVFVKQAGVALPVIDHVNSSNMVNSVHIRVTAKTMRSAFRQMEPVFVLLDLQARSANLNALKEPMVKIVLSDVSAKMELIVRKRLVRYGKLKFS